jgi:iron complex outermembrane recepter protein
MRAAAALPSSSLVFLCLTAPWTAFAQQVAAPAAPASVASAAARTLPQVTVTGEKTRRSLDKTAPSVTVWTEADLANQPGLLSQRALLDNSVNITSSGNQNLAPAVRGINGTGPSQGADAFTAGTRSRLNIVVDGRPASYNEITFGDLGLWDVARVEVFRGAQSTLQGRNAIAGTIVYQTNEPSFTPEYAVRAMVGSDQQRQFSALASGPLIDQELAYRLAFDGARKQSFVTGYSGFEGVDDPGRFESGSLRGKLLWKPSALPGLRNTLSLARTQYQGPQTEGVDRPFDNLHNAYPQMPVFAPRVDSGTLETSWDLFNGWAVENTMVAGRFKVKRKAVPGDGNALIDGRDGTLEPRLRYTSADKSVTALLGLHAFHAKQHDTIDLFGGGEWHDRTDTRSLYGETTFAATPSVDVTVGGRYENEHRVRQGSLGPFVTDFDETYRVFLPKLNVAWKADASNTVGLSLSRGYNGGNAGFTYDVPYVNYTYSPEYVWNLEGFVRSRGLGDRLQVTGNVFYSRYKDMQTPFDLNPDPAVWSYVVRNAPRAVTYGAEGELQWLATPELRLRAALGLLKARITEYPDSGVEGHALPRSPKLTATLGATWQNEAGFNLGGSARYSTGYHSDVTNFGRGWVKPGWTANLNAGYTNGKAKVFAFVNNVFDSKRPILVDADPNAADDSADVGMLPHPRSFGVGVEFWF